MTASLPQSLIATVLLWTCLAQPAFVQPAPPQDRNQLPPNELAPPGAGTSDVPGGMTPGSDPFMLLQNNSQVQADLGLSEDQIRRLSHSGQIFRTRLQELAQATDASSKAEMQRHIWTSRGAIAHLLTPEQLRRLQQIMLQIQGPCMAVSDPRLSQDLGLGETQLRTMAIACRQVAADMREVFRPASPNEDPCVSLHANRARIEQVRMEGQARVVALLSESQQHRLREMQGRGLALDPVMPPQCGR